MPRQSFAGGDVMNAEIAEIRKALAQRAARVRNKHKCP